MQGCRRKFGLKGEDDMAAHSHRKRRRRLIAAEGYLELELPDAALEELDAITTPHEALFSMNVLRGEALRMKGDWKAALKAYQKAIIESPHDVSVLMAMAWCFKRSRQLPRAIAAMQRAYQISPKEPIVLYNLSCYFALADDKANALSWLGRAIRMDEALRELIPEETDFDGLRHDPDFQFITGERATA